MKYVCASPKGYELDADSLNRANAITANCAVQTHDPIEAVNNADVVYTDTWVSMGQEDEKAQRIAAFKGFSVDEKLMKNAPKQAKIMHCLPAYRGYEISDSVVESENSVIFDQAENRLHFQRALLKYLMSN
jgi:ornithine carbamoyltransferase